MRSVGKIKYYKKSIAKAELTPYVLSWRKTYGVRIPQAKTQKKLGIAPSFLEIRLETLPRKS